MSTKSGFYKGHRFHGTPERFEVLADYIFNRYGKTIKYIADVAGGRGMLSRILNKKYNYQTEVIDQRGWPLVGVPNRKVRYSSRMATYYDLIVGLHPDEATRAIAESALYRPTILLPCCNFWDKTVSLGTEALIMEISKFYQENKIIFEKMVFNFNSPKNIGLITTPTFNGGRNFLT